MPEKTSYPITDEMRDRIARDFTHDSLVGDQPERYAQIREKGKGFAHDIVCRTPPSREQSLALTKIEEAVMWAIAAIARNEIGDSDED